MNDEKTAIINMLSEGTLILSEGIALFETLCSLEDMGSFQWDVEAEDPRHLPPWVSEDSELFELLFENRCTRAIASANQEIITALREGNLGSVSRGLTTLDVIQLSGFKLRPREGGNGGFAALDGINVKAEDNGLRTRGGGVWISCWRSTEDMKLPPTWWESMFSQVFGTTKFLRLKWEAGEVISEEVEHPNADQMELTSTVESFGDSVVTKAGKFDNCLKLKTVIRGVGGQEFKDVRNFDVNGGLWLTGTQHIWLAPNVGIVKFLYEHPNDTRTEVELVEYHLRGGEPLYFPLSLGNIWRYQWQDELVIHKELLRVILRNEDGSFTLCCAKPMIEIA